MTKVPEPAQAFAMFRMGPRPGIVIGLIMLALIGAVVIRLVVPVEAGTASAARRAVAAGRYHEAANALAHWLSSEPNLAEVHQLKGRVAVGLGRLNEAADELKQAHALGQPGDDLALLRALIAAKLGRSGEAEPVLSRAFQERHGPDRQVDEALAKIYLETYDLARSATVLDVWARDFPDDPKPYLWRAEVHGRAPAHEGMVENDYREALKRDRSLAPARMGLAEALRKAHRNVEAVAEYDACLALEPNDATAHLGAGRNLMELGDVAAAKRHFDRALALAPTSALAHQELAEAAGRRGDWAAALTLLDRAITLDPFDLSVRHSRGLALARLGRLDEARTEQAAAARLRHDLSRLNDARARVIASPHDGNSQLEVARWMFDHAHDDEGARWALKVLAERPDDPEASRLLAEHHDRRGETGLANFYRLHATAVPGPAALVGSEAAPRLTP
jgi:tetratricopeptide (TPR) repeat protein